MKVLCGIGIALLGAVSLMFSMQYASLLTAAGNNAATRDHFNLLSALFGYGGIAVVLLGVGITIWAIRKMNASSRGSSSG